VWALDGDALTGSSGPVRTGESIKSHTVMKGRFDRRETVGSFVSTLSERPVRKQETARTENSNRFELKSLILAQIERWRHALHMQVERQHGGNPGGEWRTGE
jgi:hypothetical protein